MKRYSGFNVIELMVVLLVISIFFVVFLGKGYFKSRVDSANLEAAFAYAQKIVRAAEIVRKNPASVTYSAVPAPHSTVTYNTLPAGSSVDDLNALLAEDLPVPTLNPFGFDYEIEITSDYVEVLVRVPLEQYTELWPHVIDGTTRVYSVNHSNEKPQAPIADFVKSDKKDLHKEGARW